jgi:hypothetical protein
MESGEGSLESAGAIALAAMIYETVGGLLASAGRLCSRGRDSCTNFDSEECAKYYMTHTIRATLEIPTIDNRRWNSR